MVYQKETFTVFWFCLRPPIQSSKMRKNKVACPSTPVACQQDTVEEITKKKDDYSQAHRVSEDELSDLRLDQNLAKDKTEELGSRPKQ